MIDAVILDLGNVLAFHDNAKLFREVARLFGTTIDAASSRLDATLWDDVNRGRYAGDALRRELIRRFDTEVTEGDWYKVWNCHFTINTSMVRLVETLIGKVRLVLLSNTHDLHFNFLRPQLPVLDRFDGLTLSYEVGAIKPEAEIYAHALAQAHVAAERAAFFDDVEAYVQAASRIGLHGRLFTSAENCVRALEALGLNIGPSVSDQLR